MFLMTKPVDELIEDVLDEVLEEKSPEIADRGGSGVKA